MEKVILIDCSVTYTRIGLVKDNKLEQIYLQNNFEEDLQNVVIQGQITDVVRNLQAVFVDFGGDKNGLLHFKQIPECYKTRLTPGQRLPIQIMRENVGNKGHKLTAFINVIGKNLVCLPFEEGISISKKIKNTDKREYLKQFIKNESEEKYGFIARTSSEYVSEEELVGEVKDLVQQADQLMREKSSLAKGSIILKDKNLAIKIILEHLRGNERLKIICNSEEYLKEIQEVLTYYTPKVLHEYVQLEKIENVFKFYDVEKHFEESLRKKVWLKNGGNLVIEPTEALTVIDVNSAKAVIKKNPQKALLDLNQLAIEESVRQIIKRNISGMIVVDLVDLRSKEDKEALYGFARKCLETLDRGRSVTYPITELGLLQIVRTKRYMSLYQSMYTNCSSCQTIGGEYKMIYWVFMIEQKIKQILRNTNNKQLFITCKPKVYEYILQNNLKKNFEKIYSIEIELLRETRENKDVYNITYHI